ncbi:MAG: hypothetical protein ACO3NZ_04380 [Pirellulales bacterium]|jgi:hypothetical protein
MRCFLRLRHALVTSVMAAVCLIMAAGQTSAVEMFTYFGDGSRIGLPSLEVPIEAYPGIPLRSDRLRARRAGKPEPRGTVGQFRGRGITIRVPAQQAIPMDAPMPEPVLDPTPAEVEPVPAEPAEIRGANLDFGGLRELAGFDETLQR